MIGYELYLTRTLSNGQVVPRVASFKGEPERLFVDVIVDKLDNELCLTCLDRLMPMPHSFGNGPSHAQRARCWWFERKLTDVERKAAYDYLANPVCQGHP